MGLFIRLLAPALGYAAILGVSDTEAHVPGTAVSRTLRFFETRPSDGPPGLFRAIRPAASTASERYQVLARVPASRPSLRRRDHDDPTIQRALDVLKQDVNPVKVVDFDEVERLYQTVGLSQGTHGLRERRRGLGGFRVSNDPHLYINSDSREYRNAKNPKNRAASIILAGILAHEQTHETERGNPSEPTAYRIESDFLRDQLRRQSLPPDERTMVKERLRFADGWAEQRQKKRFI